MGRCVIVRVVPLGIFLVFQVVALVRGAPFLPTRLRTVKTMVALADIRRGEKAADLGSGALREKRAAAMGPTARVRWRKYLSKQG